MTETGEKDYVKFFERMSDKDLAQEYSDQHRLLDEGKIESVQQLQTLLEVGAEDIRRLHKSYPRFHPFRRTLEGTLHRLEKARDGGVEDKVEWLRDCAERGDIEPAECSGGETLRESLELKHRSLMAHLNLADKLEQETQ